MRLSITAVVYVLVLMVGFVLPALAQEDPPPLLSTTDLVFYPNGNAASSFYGVVTDADGNVYTVDSFKSFVLKYDADGNFIETIGAGRGSGDGQFAAPENLAIDASGNLFVADKDNHRIQKFSNTGEFLFEFGSAGSGDGQFNQPRGIAIHPNGDIYVCDFFNSRMQVFDSSGNFKMKWGSWGSGNDQFIGLRGVDFDVDGNVLTIEWDSSTNRVKRTDPNGVFIEEVYRFSGSVKPFALDVGPSGTIWVVSILNGAGTPTAFKIDPAGTLLTSWYAPNTRGIQEGGNGNLYTSNNGTLDIWGPVRVATDKASWGSFKSLYR
ncbi:MAG: hypothetical protein DRP71_14555 [Verrucomicrobia bacterium]|nr:MAG: hypothetical protein DRP71_14555 [Verrucomicrobiota bacterium]